MQISILKERWEGEGRVAASPDSVRHFLSLGAEVVVESGAGESASFPDSLWQECGARLAKDAREATKQADCILKVRCPMSGSTANGQSETALFSKGQIVICSLGGEADIGDRITELNQREVSLFGLERLPRITRAQSMDILSSQSSLAGYRAVLEASALFGRAMPMMMTAAGTAPPARVMVMGAGVAGLQAIATARRLGALVSATDVRPAVADQVKSLGAKFIAVEDEEFQRAQTETGYAKPMSKAYQAKQQTLIAKTLPTQDIVITTALAVGRQAPVLISADMVASMKAGSVIIDLASEAGGNCALSKHGQTIEAHGVKIMAPANICSSIPDTASRFFARNLQEFLTVLLSTDKQSLIVDEKDEIINATLVCHSGKIRVKEWDKLSVKPSATETAAGKRPIPNL